MDTHTDTQTDMDAGMHMGMDMDHAPHACPHCPPSMHEDCDGDATESCDYLERFDTDRRASKAKIGVDPVDPQVALPASYESLPAFSEISLHSDLTKHATAPPGPPLNVLFCVYLR